MILREFGEKRLPVSVRKRLLGAWIRGLTKNQVLLEYLNLNKGWERVGDRGGGEKGELESPLSSKKSYMKISIGFLIAWLRKL